MNKLTPKNKLLKTMTTTEKTLFLIILNIPNNDLAINDKYYHKLLFLCVE